ncbi:oligosaccharide flippase family protein [Sphingomonas canadensis]|uniref:Oligosaccharide flippase family protein n=1 Tax=Sphingomonas canadensis TaxID=1219257 RepID=A0ABW3H428_9SPHN|nr:oligosaccharide flippase family protein [Sphingomonas canadensis]MCW3835412.1 oligosaccharide flippase family protein [Sphingomonas canadensis]
MTSSRPVGGYWRQVSTLMGGTAAAQAIGILSMLVLARLYSPHEFGGYALFFAISGLLALISTGKYDGAVFLARDADEAAELALLSLCIAQAAGIALLALLPLSALLAGAATDHPFLFMLLLAPATASGGAVAALTAWATQIKRFADISAARLLQAAAAAAISILLAFANWGEMGLIAGFVAGQVLFAAMLGFRLGLFGYLRRLRPGTVLTHAKANARFPRYLVPSEVFNYLGAQLVAFVTPALFSAAALGQYSLGQRVAAMPISVIGSAMGSVFRSAVGPQHSTPEDILPLFRSTLKRLCLAGALVTLPLLVAGPQLFAFVFGAKWHDAGFYLQLMSPVVFARFVVSPLSVILLLAGRQRLDAILQAMYAMSALAAVGTGAWLGSFVAMVVSLTVFQMLLYAGYLIISYRLAKDMSAR